jgi:hypothetical protein
LEQQQQQTSMSVVWFSLLIFVKWHHAGVIPHVTCSTGELPSWPNYMVMCSMKQMQKHQQKAAAGGDDSARNHTISSLKHTLSVGVSFSKASCWLT